MRINTKIQLPIASLILIILFITIPILLSSCASEQISEQDNKMNNKDSEKINNNEFEEAEEDFDIYSEEEYADEETADISSEEEQDEYFDEETANISSEEEQDEYFDEETADISSEEEQDEYFDEENIAPTSNKEDKRIINEYAGEEKNQTSELIAADPNKDSSGAKESIENITGKWRIYSQAIFYDKGGNDWLDYPSTRTLQIKEDGSWTFGTSQGTWGIKSINPEDWTRWTSNPYGPTKKIILNGWNKGFADGPIELSETGQINFVWVIYRAEPPITTWPGVAQIKFGHTQ